jgi:hypothetical protein
MSNVLWLQNKYGPGSLKSFRKCFDDQPIFHFPLIWRFKIFVKRIWIEKKVHLPFKKNCLQFPSLEKICEIILFLLFFFPEINEFKRDNTPLKILICGLWISRSNQVKKSEHGQILDSGLLLSLTLIVLCNDQNVHHNARGGVARPSTISHACSSVRSAARSASAFPQGIMGIKLCALATTTGRPRKEGLSALEQ